MVRNWLRRGAEGLHILWAELVKLPEYNEHAERLRAELRKEAVLG